MRLFRKLLLWAVFLLYIAVLLRITVFRSDFGTHPLFREGRILWVPFVSLYRILRNSTGWFLYYLVGNLIWFIPAGLLLPDRGHGGGGSDPQYPRRRHRLRSFPAHPAHGICGDLNGQHCRISRTKNCAPRRVFSTRIRSLFPWTVAFSSPVTVLAENRYTLGQMSRQCRASVVATIR